MSATTKTPFVIAFVVVAVLFLLFGIGAMTGTMMNAGWMGTGWMDGNGMMGNGWMGGSGWMGGFSWMWIPTLLTLGLGILLGWVLFGKRDAAVKNE
jgi:hypothetical protein